MKTHNHMFKDIQKMVKSVVIKYDRKAKATETLESKRNADMYIIAKEGTDTFYSNIKFSYEALEMSGITDVTLINECIRDKNNIPEDKRDAVVLAQRYINVRDYVEMNDYYRELSGLPNLNDMNYVYVPEDIALELNIDPNIPIHELPKDNIVRLKNSHMPSIISRFPEKKYLNYLGDRSIDPYVSRKGKTFDILFREKDFDPVFTRYFFTTYESCREYFMSVIYVREFGTKFDLYDNFIAMNIMIMTIQRLMVSVLKLAVERDFYDLNSIKVLFDSYGVPFFEDLPLDYQKSIMKNLNMLLRYKSTDKVLYDISSILFFDRIKIFKYFLVKEQKFDASNNPIFIYKEDTDEFGDKVIVEDFEQMYDLYFQSTNVLERNTALALENDTTKISYMEITENDVLWWNDENVQKMLYEEEFNYVETKYISANVMYKMTQIMFESIYAFNMLADLKDNETSKIYITIPRITLDKVSVFDAVMLLCALLSKKNSMKGNIINEPSKILHVLGFNFKEDFDSIRKNIRDNHKIFDQEVLKYIEKLDVTNPNEVDAMYKNIKGLADFCTHKVTTTENIKEYHAYKYLYEALMVKEYNTDILTMSNGKVAETYLEYLKDKAPNLAIAVEECSKDKTGVYIEHITGKLNELIPDLEHMNSVNGTDNILTQALLKLIEFFKSYTVDLNSLNVVYLMDSRYYNTIRMVHDIQLLDKTIQPNDTFFTHYFDRLMLEIGLSKQDKLKIVYDNYFRIHILIKYLQEIVSKEYYNKVNVFNEKMDLTYSDRISMDNMMKNIEKYNIVEDFNINVKIKNTETASYYDTCREIIANIGIDEKLLSLYNDFMRISGRIEETETISTHEVYNIILDIYFKKVMTTEEKFSISTEIGCKMNMNIIYNDALSSVEGTIPNTEKVNLTEASKVYHSISDRDKTHWSDKVKELVSNYMIHLPVNMVEAISLFKDISIHFNMTTKEWYDIYRIFSTSDRVKSENKINTISENTNINLNVVNTELLSVIKSASFYMNVNIEELVKVFYNLSINDSLVYKYNISGYKGFIHKKRINLRTMINSSKHIHKDLYIPIREIFDITRHIHREYKLPLKEKVTYDSTSEIRENDLIEEYMKLYTLVKHNKMIMLEEVTKVILRHNFTLHANLIHTIKSVDVSFSMKENLVHMLNAILIDMQSLVYNNEDVDLEESIVMSGVYNENEMMNTTNLAYAISEIDIDDLVSNYYNDRCLLDILINIANESIEYNHMIVSLSKDMATEFNIPIDIERHTIFSVFGLNHELIPKYNDQLSYKSNANCSSSFILFDRIKMFYE